MRPERARAAITARPVRAAQPGVGQAGERTEQHQIESQEKSQCGEAQAPLLPTLGRTAHGNPDSRSHGEQQPDEQDL